MKLATFKGGVYPPEFKQTAGLSVDTPPIPDRVAIPMVQHVGAPATVLVKIGDHVKTGQKIRVDGDRGIVFFLD